MNKVELVNNREVVARNDLGDIYMVSSYGDDGEPAMLCQVGGGEINLIGLVSGNRWGKPVKVASMSRITDKEVRMVYDEVLRLGPANIKVEIRHEA